MHRFALAILAPLVLAACEEAAGPSAASEEESALETARAAAGFAASPVREELVATPFGQAFIAERAASENDSHAAPGRLDIAYLALRDGAMVATGRYPDAVEVGSWGAMSEWRVRDDVLGVPVIEASGGYTGQGITTGCTVLVALAEDGPRRVAVVQSYFDTSGWESDRAAREQVTGTIGNVERGTGFTVTYSGTATAEVRWNWDGETFVPSGEAPIDDCAL